MTESTHLASRWKRLGGFLIDGLTMFLLLAPLLFATGVAQRRESLTFAQNAMVVAAGWLVFLGVNGYLLSSRGQTVGKLVMKTRIVDLDGNIPGFARVFILRYLIPGLFSHLPMVGFIPGLGYLLVFDAKRRTLHDYLAGTRVVDAVRD